MSLIHQWGMTGYVPSRPNRHVPNPLFPTAAEAAMMLMWPTVNMSLTPLSERAHAMHSGKCTRSRPCGRRLLTAASGPEERLLLAFAESLKRRRDLKVNLRQKTAANQARHPPPSPHGRAPAPQPKDSSEAKDCGSSASETDWPLMITTHLRETLPPCCGFSSLKKNPLWTKDKRSLHRSPTETTASRGSPDPDALRLRFWDV
ncbi:hypothetical protein EYF80_040256 [Liparis tanakae]|uniref:Uncharacterized protein n=1 Tax=Liparis tanakae TaxID=230148 RepID=A0A4Z2G7N5_9TELE|nr:hypothetical protein EYF80_040256 [Liparis tanakae]